MTYAYQFVLVSVVSTMTLLSVLITKQSGEQASTFQFIFDEHGVCSFDFVPENTVDSTIGRKKQFQLLTGSRYSFFGCWLYAVPLPNVYSAEPLSNAINKRRKKKRLFIYRDSLSAEDFSRLTQVIRNLKKTS